MPLKQLPLSPSSLRTEKYDVNDPQNNGQVTKSTE